MTWPEPSSHCAREAFRLPVTGSSAVLPSLTKKARTSNASAEPGGYGPATPRSNPQSGWARSSTACALASSTATQPGPLSAHCAPVMSSRPIRKIAAISAISASSTGPPRSNGGAAKASRPPVWRTGTRPAAHSWTMTPGVAGRPPASSQAWQVPSVGCPANGSSRPGVKIRTR